MKKKLVTEDQMYSVLKKFVVDVVHKGDFDQGQSLDDTITVMQKWWNAHKGHMKFAIDPNLITES